MATQNECSIRFLSFTAGNISIGRSAETREKFDVVRGEASSFNRFRIDRQVSDILMHQFALMVHTLIAYTCHKIHVVISNNSARISVEH